MTADTVGSRLPQLSATTWLTESGIETDLQHNRGCDLREFAAFPLLESDSGRSTLTAYYRDHWVIAAEHHVGVVFETPTWRASPDWGVLLGYDLERLASLNRAAVDLLRQLRTDVAATAQRFIVSGNIGPRTDGHVPAGMMSVAEATAYHSWQVGVLADSGADLVTMLTATYADEAIGVADAAAAARLPAVISFTTETDGLLPDGTTLRDAIDRVDQAAAQAPAYYMLNCVHPSHVLPTLEGAGAWTGRIRGFRANASSLSHAEREVSDGLDTGDPGELARLFGRVRDVVPTISVLGGCCGTDARHIAAIARAEEARGRL